MEFEVRYYKDYKGKSPIEEFLLELEVINRLLLVKVKQGIDRLRIRAYHKEPLSNYLEPGLWELRTKAGSDILRILYTFEKGRIIILLHIFVKKQQKTPQGELEIARKRFKEIKAKEIN